MEGRVLLVRAATLKANIANIANIANVIIKAIVIKAIVMIALELRHLG